MARNVVVIGTQWGDEGKGKIVDWLTDHAQGVVDDRLPGPGRAVPGEGRAGLVEVSEPLVTVGAASLGGLREEGLLEGRVSFPERPHDLLQAAGDQADIFRIWHSSPPSCRRTLTSSPGRTCPDLFTTVPSRFVTTLYPRSRTASTRPA